MLSRFKVHFICLPWEKFVLEKVKKCCNPYGQAEAGTLAVV